MVWTGGLGATCRRGMTAFEVLFSVTVYRDGQIRISGHGKHAMMPSILRRIADSIEAGATVLHEDETGDE